MHNKNILEVKDLHVSFDTRRGEVRAVNGLSFELEAGKTLGIVGESGSGKSVSMNAVMGLVRDSNVKISGEVFFKGEDLLKRSDDEMRKIRGKEIAMVFQDPMTALTPVYTVGWHIVEQIRLHTQLSKKEARDRAIEILDEVGIPDAKRRVDQYPHEFSGGMRQRAIIAMALSLNPALLIADEPTTALDVTIQAQILDLLMRLQEQHNSSIIIITHDMGVVSEIADEVLVMYAGRPVERATKQSLFANPQHPYTQGLMSSVPRLDRPRTDRLEAIPGQPASLLNLPTGCAFSNRCPKAHDACQVRPEFVVDAQGHGAACVLVGEKK
ncbi:MAG: ABC transporter ATP-binding protein [Actinomycetes bacterium]